MMFLAAAFVTGIISGLHCIVMCGPLNAALLFAKDYKSFVFYHLGRILTYSLMGLLAGLLGASFISAQWQQTSSIVTGILILTSLIPIFFTARNSPPPFILKWKNKIVNAFSKINFKSSRDQFFVLGSLNGVLPCGVIYTAIALAFSSNNALNGALTMIAFGLGTVPLLFVFQMLGKKMSATFPKMRHLNTVAALCIGILLIIRGSSLGIPYLSPKIENHEVHCCSKP